MTTPNNQQPAQEQQAYADPRAAQLAGLAQTIQASLMSAPAGSIQTKGSQQLEQVPHDGIIARIFESAEAKKNRRAMEAIRNIAIRTDYAMGLISYIGTDLVGLGIDAEASAQSIIQEYSGSQMAMAAAPYYVQIMHQLLMQNLPAVAEHGIAGIKRNI